MGAFKDKEDYLKALCVAHPGVAHGTVVDGKPRNSFFRINDDEEIMSATINNINYPAVGYVSLRGRMVDNGEGLTDIRYLWSNAWMFLQHVSMFSGSLTDNIQTCYDQTFAIMEDFITAMKNDFEENGHCGAFEDFDLSKMNFEMVGPVYEMEYGWMLYFDDQQKAMVLSSFPGGIIFPDRGDYWELE